LRALASFFKQTTGAVWLRLLLLSALSAAANVAILLLVNGRVVQSNQSRPVWVDGVLFLAAVTVFGFAHRYLIGGMTKMVEGAIRCFRVRIFNRIARLNLRDVETVRVNDLFVCINAETRTIADSSFAFATIGEQTLVVICTLIYIGWISPVGLAAAIAFIAFVSVFLIRHDDKIADMHRGVFELQGQYTEFVSDLLHGFKEVRLNAARADALTQLAGSTADAIYEEKSRLSRVLAGKHVFSEISYFTFLGITVFAVPNLMSATASQIATAAVSALFLIGPTFAVISAIPLLQKIAASAKSIQSVEDKLGTDTIPGTVSDVSFARFAHISMRSVCYRYAADGFRFGPIDLDIRRGQTIFITGRNGTGKSTLLKLLSGLYLPDEGRLCIGDSPINQSNIDAYRDLFSAIFSNNYLFKTLYGTAQPDPTETAGLF
jgi:putative ATP-binding cassette transporter